MTERELISDGTPFESTVGYSRAVRAGDTIYVSGTVAWNDDGSLAGPGDPYAQARQVLRNIEKALIRAGASMNDVVRTRMYVTDIAFAQAVGRAHGEAFGAVRPAATLVAVSALIRSDMLVEIEAEAVV